MSETKAYYSSPCSETKKVVWMKSGGRCWYCGKQTHPFGQDRDAFCVEHLYSRASGGSLEMDNLVPACICCNTVKQGRSIDEFRLVLFGKYKRFYFEKKGLQP